MGQLFLRVKLIIISDVEIDQVGGTFNFSLTEYCLTAMLWSVFFPQKFTLLFNNFFFIKTKYIQMASHKYNN